MSARTIELLESNRLGDLPKGIYRRSIVRSVAREVGLNADQLLADFTAAARSSADLIVAGTVLPTVSKSRADYLGWKGLSEVIGAAKGTPVLGIGGLDLSSMTPLAATGAAGLAAVGAFIPATGQTGLKEFVKKRVIDMRFAFDSAPI